MHTMDKCSMLYKCGKRSTNPLDLDRFCQWRGSVLDYIPHLSHYHQDSVLKMEELFIWSLVHKECTTKGVVHHKSRLFMYEMHYNKNVDPSVYFSLHGECTRFQFCLCNKLLLDYIVTNQTNSSFDNLFVPIQQRPLAVSLSQQTVNKYLDRYGRLLFKIRLLHQ